MRTTGTVLVLWVAVMLSACATIAGGGTSQPVILESMPTTASYTIQSSSGLQMGQGTTPNTVRLPRKNEYQIEITLAGYQPRSVVITKGINGWLWGNILFGWIVGFIVDFATGSAYKLEPSLVQVILAQTNDETHAVVRIYNADNKLLQEDRLLMVPDSLAR